jgi:hypothetical protein
MKRSSLLWLVILVCLCGCARHWVITLTNGSQIDSKGKPHRKDTYYVYKDALGREQRIPAGRVQEVGPASMVTEEKPAFNPGPRP